jgi:hypothetical protein
VLSKVIVWAEAKATVPKIAKPANNFFILIMFDMIFDSN